jgi:hypothetical protein
MVENVADEMFSATVLGVPDCVAEGCIPPFFPAAEIIRLARRVSPQAYSF